MMYKVKNREELNNIINRINSGDNSILLQDLDVSNVTDMSRLFKLSQVGEIDWNIHDITQWSVSQITNMSCMFSTTYFNQDISNWDISNVTDMNYMFYSSRFNQDISRWDVSSVGSMYYMFGISPFNQDISNWDISNVYNMEGMFYSSKFLKDLSNWKDRLNRNVSMDDFNENTPHKKIFGKIDSYNDFRNIKPLDDIIENMIDIIKSTDNDRKRYHALKDLKTIIELTGY